MKVMSICSGIGSDAVAWHSLGWEHICFAEIDPFASAVLAYRWPKVNNQGDFTEIGDKYRDAIDILVGGTPCQSFSVAGRRGGLADSRGNLALEFCRLTSRIRPRWLVWENVPGVLSSNIGRDFGTIIGALGQLGYGWAYRVLDAQYFGVPQRRRRVFIVGHRGDGFRAASVLFEQHSLQGHHPPCQEEREGIAKPIISGAVSAKWHKGTGGPAGDECYNLIKVPSIYGIDEEQNVSSKIFGCLKSRKGGGGFEGAMAIRTAQTSSNGWGIGEDKQAYTLDGSQGQAIALEALRRLTPRECERLQGLPDNYTRIIYNGKTASDSLRYKAIGNGMAIPVMAWIGKRIQEASQL